MTTTKRRRERQQWNPDLALLASQLQGSIQAELLDRLGAAGFEGLRPRHGPLLAYLDEDGVRSSELSELAGLHKQVVGRLVDELEQLGYVERRPDPRDRRAKLVTPTERGLELLRLGDETVAAIERRNAEATGPRAYADFRDVLRAVVARGRDGHAAPSSLSDL